ncbi:DUF3801 domain-containing protein [Streptococcus suis]|uniref:DUF3801 domain-containing protein n=1 Tax=Streptococcus suis TaxID=1307 RepID=UPI0005CD9E1A|nr:DUF3801 domain-containing protein [Streptococcus suis]MDW8750562.1 DUF3801 domain-containing protein [Streptococcus suis]NQH64079.1 DUF3801 domain-containing protein [Streptococcus suis]CYU83125.1 Uncharacterised protein [Streptococcus suis]
MDQEKVSYQIKDVAKLTGDILLKILIEMSDRTADYIKTFESNRHFTGETKWNRLMATSSTKEIKQFHTNELNLERLKTYLTDRGIAFAFKEAANGKMDFVFEAKNRAVVEKVFEELMNELTKPDTVKGLNKLLLKTPENMNLQDKLAYYRKQTTLEIAALTKTHSIKAPVKNKGTVEKS